MLVGYSRVSTEDRKLALQVDAFRGAVCEKLFSSLVSGTSKFRLGLEAALAYLRHSETPSESKPRPSPYRTCVEIDAALSPEETISPVPAWELPG